MLSEVKSEAEVRERIAANERVVLFFGKVRARAFTLS